MFKQYILMLSVLHKEDTLFIPKNESSLEQYKRNVTFLINVNNSITTKLCVTLLNNRRFVFLNIFSARHKSMTKLCRSLFQCDNKLKFGRGN